MWETQKPIWKVWENMPSLWPVILDEKLPPPHIQKRIKMASSAFWYWKKSKAGQAPIFSNYTYVMPPPIHSQQCFVFMYYNLVFLVFCKFKYEECRMKRHREFWMQRWKRCILMLLCTLTRAATAKSCKFCQNGPTHIVELCK